MIKSINKLLGLLPDLALTLLNTILLPYLATAFILWEFDPANWKEEIRLMAVAMSLIAHIIQNLRSR